MYSSDRTRERITKIGTAPYSRRGLVQRGTALGLGAAATLATTSNSGAQGDAVELTILDHQAPRIALLEEMLPKFEEEMTAQGKNITVNVQEAPAPDTEFQTKLTLDFSSGNAPDVTSFGATLTADFAAAGYLLDLTDRANEWTDWGSHFYEQLRNEQLQADGKMYSIPREASIIQLFYRKDVLEELGVSTEQPMSWQDLLDRMKEVTDQTGNPSLLFPAGEAWGGGTFFEGFIHLMLGTDSLLYDESDQKWVVRSPGLTQVLTFYENMTSAGVLPVEALLNPEPWVATKYQAFPAGELVATTSGTWGWIFDWGAEGAAPIEDVFDKVATWEFPTASGEETFVWGASGWVWAIAAQSEHPDEAWELVKWLSSGEFMAANAVTIGATATRDDIQDVAPYSDNPFLIEAEERLPGARAFQAPEGTDRMIQAVGQATEAIITGEQTGEEAADTLAEQATELLGEDKVKEIQG
jgi:multiple sugar transport system substrate-binding protein